MKYSKKVIGVVAALALAASLSACDTEEDPNGNTGDTDNTTATTENTTATTLTPGTTTTLGDVTTTTAP